VVVLVSSHPLRRAAPLAALMLLVGLAACEDSPTAPGVFTHSAEGQLWAALAVPAGTPTVRTWMPYVRADEVAAVTRSVRELNAEADRLRRQGAIDAAGQKEVEAALLAARSLAHAPPPHLLNGVVGAIENWSTRARLVAESGVYPEAEEALREVQGYRAAAAAALLEGDTATAVVELTTAAGVVRSLAPAAVASRVVARAELRLRDQAATDADAARALRLLRNAREALAAGDELRAFRRAMYALQLAEGNGAPAAGAAPASATEPR
jgi:hypothetical protein